MKDQITAEGKWQFDQAVTYVFDDMLRRSIPQYEAMRHACIELARRFRQPGTDIVDLGCSRGEAMAQLVSDYGPENRFLGVELSQPMLEASRIRFADAIRDGYVRIEECDLASTYPTCRASITLSILTLQFIPVQQRQRILKDVSSHTIDGGALIVVEKVLGNGACIDEAMICCYHELKARNGYSAEAIRRKRLSLEGVLVPMTARWNEELLRQADFREVDCFWRWMNFAGWIALK